MVISDVDCKIIEAKRKSCRWSDHFNSFMKFEQMRKSWHSFLLNSSSHFHIKYCARCVILRIKWAKQAIDITRITFRGIFNLNVHKTRFYLECEQWGRRRRKKIVSLFIKIRHQEARARACLALRVRWLCSNLDCCCSKLCNYNSFTCQGGFSVVAS